MVSCLRARQAWIDTGTFTKAGKNPVLFKLPLVHQIAYEAGHPETVARFRAVQLPCGKCILCRKSRSQAVAVRAIKEASLYPQGSSFITLTFDDAHLASCCPHGLDHRQFQLFMKRLGKRLGKCPRFLMCGEYGSLTARPHFHAVLFGFVSSDPITYPDGTWCESKTILDAWSVGGVPLGSVRCTPCNDNRVFYVAGYTLKDQQVGRDDDWYDARGLTCPYQKWSRNPGLGFEWFRRFGSDCYHSGYDFDLDMPSVDSSVILGRKKVPFSCRYFDTKFALQNPAKFDKLRAYRIASTFADSVARDGQSAIDASNRLKNRAEIITRRLAAKQREVC